MLRRQTQGESRERETTSASSILTRAFYFFSLLLLKMLVKEERGGGRRRSGCVPIVMCLIISRKQAETFAFSHGSAQRHTRPFSLSLSLLIIFSFDFPHLVIFHLLLHVVFSLSCCCSLSHTESYRLLTLDYTLGQIRPLNCLDLPHY